MNEQLTNGMETNKNDGYDLAKRGYVFAKKGTTLSKMGTTLPTFGYELASLGMGLDWYGLSISHSKERFFPQTSDLPQILFFFKIIIIPLLH